MTDPNDEGRRYSDEEFSLILRRAAELQISPHRPAGHSVAPRDGFSLAEIKQIAGEAGIDPRFVEDAAALVSLAEEGALVRLLGGPSTYQVEQVVSGEVPREELGRVVDAIRKAARHQGKVESVLDSVEWKTVGEVSECAVNVTPRDGSTTIRIVVDRGAAGFLVYVFTGLVWVIGAVGVGSSIDPALGGSVAIFAGAIGGAFVTARIIWKATTAGWRARLSRITDAARRAALESGERGADADQPHEPRPEESATAEP